MCVLAFENFDCPSVYHGFCEILAPSEYLSTSVPRYLGTWYQVPGTWYQAPGTRTMFTAQGAVIATSRPLFTAQRAVIGTNRPLFTAQRAVIGTSRQLFTAQRAVIGTSRPLFTAQRAVIAPDKALITAECAVIASFTAGQCLKSTHGLLAWYLVTLYRVPGKVPVPGTWCQVPGT